MFPDSSVMLETLPTTLIVCSLRAVYGTLVHAYRDLKLYSIIHAFVRYTDQSQCKLGGLSIPSCFTIAGTWQQAQ